MRHLLYISNRARFTPGDGSAKSMRNAGGPARGSSRPPCSHFTARPRTCKHPFIGNQPAERVTGSLHVRYARSHVCYRSIACVWSTMQDALRTMAPALRPGKCELRCQKSLQRSIVGALRPPRTALRPEKSELRLIAPALRPENSESRFTNSDPRFTNSESIVTHRDSTLTIAASRPTKSPSRPEKGE